MTIERSPKTADGAPPKAPGASNARNVVVITMMSGLSVLLNTAAQGAYAYFFGSHPDLDAYFVSITLPTYVLTLITASANSAFVPHSLKILDERGAEEAERFARSVLLWVAVASLAMSSVGI